MASASWSSVIIGTSLALCLVALMLVLMLRSLYGTLNDELREDLRILRSIRFELLALGILLELFFEPLHEFVTVYPHFLYQLLPQSQLELCTLMLMVLIGPMLFSWLLVLPTLAFASFRLRTETELIHVGNDRRLLSLATFCMLSVFYVSHVVIRLVHALVSTTNHAACVFFVSTRNSSMLLICSLSIYPLLIVGTLRPLRRRGRFTFGLDHWLLFAVALVWLQGAWRLSWVLILLGFLIARTVLIEIGRSVEICEVCGESLNASEKRVGRCVKHQDPLEGIIGEVRAAECLQCGAILHSLFEPCSECGMSLMFACPRCKTSVSASDNICWKCEEEFIPGASLILKDDNPREQASAFATSLYVGICAFVTGIYYLIKGGADVNAIFVPPGGATVLSSDWYGQMVLGACLLLLGVILLCARVAGQFREYRNRALLILLPFREMLSSYVLFFMIIVSLSVYILASMLEWDVLAPILMTISYVALVHKARGSLTMLTSVNPVLKVRTG